MKKTFKNIKESVHLNAEKKASLRENIENKISFFEKDVRIDSPNRLTVGAGESASQNLYTKNKTMFVTIITAISLLLAGGASFAAEGSVPGDFLYPIKIHVNESVQSAFAISAESEAELQVEKIEERMREKSELEVEGKLTAEADAEIQSKIQASITRFEKEKSTLEKNERIESANSLSLRLNALIGANSSTASETNNNFQSSSNEANADVEISSETRTENNSDISDSNTQSSSNTNATVDTSINTNIKTKIGSSTKAILDAATETSAEVKADIKTNIDAGIDAGVELKNNIEADINTGVDTMTQGLDDTINSINLDLSTSASSEIDGEAQSSESESLIDLGDESATLDTATSVTSTTGLGIR